VSHYAALVYPVLCSSCSWIAHPSPGTPSVADTLPRSNRGVLVRGRAIAVHERQGQGAGLPSCDRLSDGAGRETALPIAWECLGSGVTLTICA
jgi:hypothetical protein